MQLPITLMYAGIFAIFGLVLSFRAGGYRGTAGVSLLFGEPVNWELAERVRAHQNFLEYVPILLILMGLIEANGGELDIASHPTTGTAVTLWLPTHPA